MNFDFNEVKVEVTTSNYLKPGNYIVKGVEVKSGESSQKQSPFIEITVENDGKTASQQYYLNTEVKEGSTKSAMDISAQSIVQIVAAANNINIFDKDETTATTNKDKAKALIGKITSKEALATKLSSLLVGKEWGMHLSGEWKNPNDPKKQPWVKAVFGSGMFAVTKSNFDTIKTREPKIKGTPATSTNGTTEKATSGW